MLLCLGIFYSWPFASHASHYPLPCLAQRPSTVTASILAVYRVPCSFPTAHIATYILVWLTLPGRTRHSTLRLASTQLKLHLSRPDALAAPNPYPLVLTVLENEPYARRGGAVTAALLGAAGPPYPRWCKFINLLAERSDEVATFLKSAADVRGEVKAKALALEESIDLQDYRDVQTIPWQPNPNHYLMYLLQYRVLVDEESYVVQPVISPSGWQIQLFYRVSPKSQSLR